MGQIARIRAFNRFYTNRIGLLDRVGLKDLSLTEARAIYEIGSRMDTNALAMPTEAFGFSNRARARFGPPAFRKAAFDLPEPGARLTISLDRADR